MTTFLTITRAIAVWMSLFAVPASAATPMILAGDETDLPADTPSKRIDSQGAASPFAYVGAIAIRSGGVTYRGAPAPFSPRTGC
jgi:hypothetical protein